MKCLRSNNELLASFSTENADYRLVYAAHFLETKEDIFDEGKIESLDAIVLESGINSIPYYSS